MATSKGCQRREYQNELWNGYHRREGKQDAQGKPWIEGVQAAMTTRNLEPDQWRNKRNGFLFPEDSGQLLKILDR